MILSLGQNPNNPRTIPEQSPKKRRDDPLFHCPIQKLNTVQHASFLRTMNALYPFTVKTMTGLVIPCEYQTYEFNLPDLYYAVWNRLPEILRQDAKPWNIQLLSPGEGEAEGEGEGEAEKDEKKLLDVVRNGGVLYLLVHTDHHLDSFIQQTPFDFVCPEHPGVLFVRRIFKACYHTADVDLSWRVEAYVGLGTDGFILYHADDVSRDLGCIRQFSLGSTAKTCPNVLDLIVRAYDHQWIDWRNTPHRLLPALYDTWTRLLLEEITTS
jgi:hypothetical protein